MDKEKSCGIIVVNDQKVLMVKQNNGFWSFPKGHMEAGETKEETAIREVKEETNIAAYIDSDNVFSLSYIMDNGKAKEVYYFIGYAMNPNELKPQETEIEIVKWVDIDQVRDVLSFDNMKILWDDIIKHIKK